MRDETQSYLKSLERKLKTGDATEQTHRGALERYVESTASRITVLNEARHIACGAPDLTVRNGPVPVGHIECKDIGADLNRIEKSDQLKRYREGLSNLILTDHLEFRWFRDGDKVRTLRIGGVDERGRIVADPDGAAALELMLAEFVDDEAKTIARADDLARRMAGQTRLIYDTLIKALEQERTHAAETGVPPDSLSFHGQLEGFREALIPDLSEEDFADMYAQTIAYGLFAARWEHDPAKLFDRKSATFELPKTNPFLTRTFVRIGGADMDDNLHWIVDDLAEVLNRTDLAAIRRAFRGETRRDDPVVHFYETFLAAYDSKRREARGVYYTPGPVVEFIVKSVDKLLKRDFGLAHGLSDETRLEDGPAYEELLPQQERSGERKGPTGKLHKVQILDPAAGTGTFLHHVVDHIFHDRFNLPGPKSLKGQWPAYVRDHLLPRLNGFEFLMAPYAIGHLKLNLKLKETGAELQGGERINLFLTNTLEEPPDLAQKFTFTQWLVEEAKAAGAVKRDMPVMVVLGNPPYSGHSQNPSEREVPVAKGAPVESYAANSFAPKISTATRDGTRKQRTFIGHLLKGWDPEAQKPAESYFHLGGEPLGERNPKWLQDDYVKFIRFSQWRIERTGHGILAFITNNGYLDNPTFRGMRHSLLRAFDDLYILDLHGSTLKKERAPDGGKDENVFDIQPGVAILIAVRKPGPRPPPVDGKPALAKVHHKDLWGRREISTNNEDGTKTVTGGKYHWLAENDVETVDWETLEPEAPAYGLTKLDEEKRNETRAYIPLLDLFTEHTPGIVTARDKLCIAFDIGELKPRIEKFIRLPEEEARTHFQLGDDVRDWHVKDAQADLLQSNLKTAAASILYRPFDTRSTFYTGNTAGFMCMPRPAVMPNMRQQNLGLLVPRQTKDDWACLVSDQIVGHKSVSRYDISSIFPLYVYANDADDLLSGLSPWPAGPGGRRPNLAKGVVDGIAAGLGLDFVSDGRGDLAATVGPEDLVDWIYAVLHAPSYRSRYAEFLKSDFPRVPFPTSAQYGGPGFFAALCAKGRRLVDLHLMRDADEDLKPGFPVAGGNIAARPRWEPGEAAAAPDAGGRVWLNETQYFDGVPKETWEFRVGGYQVCEKWLKDRRDRDLSGTDIDTYRTIVAALTETRRLMAEIDSEIQTRGGWPIR